MTAPLINRTFRPGSGSAYNANAAGPVPAGATVPTASMGGGQWSPTVANLLVLIVVEMAAFAAIRYLFRKVL